MADHRDTLLLPFEKELLAVPQSGEEWALLNASLLPSNGLDLSNILACEQSFRPQYLTLAQSGYCVEPHLSGLENQSGVLVLATRSRKLNETNLTRAWNATKPGGLIVVAGAKKSGIQPLRKWAGEHTEIVGSLSKHHAIVFWLRRNSDGWPLPEFPTLQDGYHVAPGMFSADGPDAGSQLLVDHFGPFIRGRVADFGAGWGYLSAELLKRTEKVEKLELYEADWNALEAAKLNVEGPVEFHWADLTSEAPRGPFDWIIMNPPFHTGRAAEPKLGALFIEAAAKALPSGGRLLMVANTNLPYEKTLENNFKRVERKAQKNGFKVIEAVR